MGKAAPKMKNGKDVELDDCDGVDELYRPFLIHSTTYVILTEQILSLMPSERNVLLTMNEYDLNEINPMHPNTTDSPTHVIIFCIRFIADNIFQPIGGLLIYKHKDQSAVLAECLKAYINDLWKLGLYVVATVSPPFETFKGILKHIVDIENFNTYSGAITYSVTPFEEIVHVYDIQFLLIKLQNLFKEGDIKFIEGTKEYRASWNDISLVLNLCIEFKILSNYLLDNKDVSRRVHIFTQQIFEQLLELEAQGALSENAEGSAVLLNCVRSFLQFTELDLVDLNSMSKVDCWDSLADILQTMIFQKSKTRTCTKMDGNVDIEQLANNIDNLLIYGQENFEKNYVDEMKMDVKSEITKEQQNQSNSEYIKANGNNLHDNKQKKRKKKKPYVSKNVIQNGIVDQSLESATKTESYKCLREYVTENMPFCKTDKLLVLNEENSKATKFDNKKDINCDNNNNGSKNLKNVNSTTVEEICDNKRKAKKQRKNKKKVEENFDIVINDAQKFFESFSEHNQVNSCDNVSFDVINQNQSKYKQLFLGNDQDNLEFCSQSDEETEKYILNSCDKLSNIIELLNVENKEASDDFEQNNVTFEILCTVFGMQKLIGNLIKRRVRAAKPDAFVVEHIDFLVTLIKRDKNNINPVYYYGHNYGFLNAQLAFVTLHNKNGLYLISK